MQIATGKMRGKTRIRLTEERTDRKYNINETKKFLYKI